MSEWKFNNEVFEDAPEEYIGFVYEITDTETNMKYIGKKKFWSKVTRPPLKGRKNKRRSIKESDWKSYYGSSEVVKELVENTGEWRFERRILRLCKTAGELSYYEMKEQVENDVLLKPNEYHHLLDKFFHLYFLETRQTSHIIFCMFLGVPNYQ